MKIFSAILVLISFGITIPPVQAEPRSCKISAITTKEKSAVDILQEMYYVQSDLGVKQKSLDELNSKMSKRPDRTNAKAVDLYNNLVNEYNNFVLERNQLSNEYNKLKDEYNSLVNYISPSTNLAFINCLNSELLNLSTNATRLNIDSLNTRVNSLRNQTGDL